FDMGGQFFMALLDWLFRRRQISQGPLSERSANASERRHTKGGEMNSASCPECGATARQTRTDGRCIGCGKLLPEELRAPPQPSPETPTPGAIGTLSSLVAELLSKGFRGPIAIACDRIPSVLLFHGPDVPIEPAWLESTNNPFNMRV